MLIDQMKHMSNERQNFIRGIIDMSYEYITDIENYTDNCLERNDIINRSFDTDISDEIELLLYNNERLIKHYNKNKSWFEIESYYLDSDAILWFERNNINYVAIKHIEDTQYYTIFVRYENDRKLFELIYKNNTSVSLSCSISKDFLDNIEHILLTSNWTSIKNPITEIGYAQFYNHLTEVGEQYIDWLKRLNIKHYDIWPLEITSNKLLPNIYFKNKDHINLYKSALVELRMLI